MTRMVWLPTVLREAGLNVVETTGWKTRGRDGEAYSMRPRVVIGHHTASLSTTPDTTVTALLVNGRTDLPGPLCHLGLNRAGTYIVIAGGKANHAGAGQWMDANESVEAIGIEAYNYGAGVPFPSREPWSQVQLDAYDRGIAALLKYLGRDERSYCGHREWAQPPGRKPDPSGIDLNAQRSRIRTLLQKDNTVILQPGTRGYHVIPWQRALNAALIKNNINHPQLATDGIYGPSMESAVSAYQAAAQVTGIVPKLGALDDYTRDLLVEYTRDDG